MQTVSGKKIAVADQFSKERDYWLQKLEGDLVLSSFPTDDVKNTGDDREWATLEFMITEPTFSRLIELSNGNDHVLHMVLMAGFVLLLKRFSGNQDILVGMPVYKQKTGGEYINTVLALRNQIQAEMTFKELLLAVRQTIIEAVEHQNYPIETLAFKLGLSTSGEFLFDTALLLDTIHEKSYLENLPLRSLLSFTRREDSLIGHFAYKPALYHEATIQRLIHHYQTIISTAIFQLDVKVKSLELFPEDELEFLLTKTTDTDNAKENLCSLFAEQVRVRPDAPAISCGGVTLSYRELDQKARQIAGFLLQKGVQPGAIVGLMVEPSLELVIGMLGIVKAGAAYLPIDRAYPAERVRFMLQDAGSSLLLTRDCDLHLPEVEVLDFTELEEIAVGETDDLPVEISPESLLYIIYTSGSTGRPKGVLVEHRGFVNLVKAHQRIFQTTSADRMSQIANISFDACAFEIWPALTLGAYLHIADELTRAEPQLLQEWFIAQEITMAFAPTPLGEVLIAGRWPAEVALRVLCLAGDKLNIYPDRQLPFRVFNLYGPTETTIWATYYPLTVERPWPTPPVGKPIDHVQIYLLDEEGNPVPVGAKGEIYIGGAGLARGYQNRPELNAKAFVVAPWSPATRLYKTGDLGSYLPDGTIVFLGRKDFQVKIRGYRIELEEIETVLHQHPVVKSCVVLVKEYGKAEKQLVSYVSFKEGESVEEVALQNWLKEKLPAYMIPQLFVIVPEMPLTRNGKIDRKALPEPQRSQDVKYVAPTNTIEENLAEIWAEILDLDQETIGIDHNFFEMGGHSLKATTFVAKLSKKLDVKIQLSEVFEAPTIRELAEIVAKKQKIHYSSIKPVEKREHYPLSSAQKRLFILEQIEDLGTSYNAPGVMLIEGQLDVERLENAFLEFIARHDALRTSFALVDGQPVQIIQEEVAFALEHQVAASRDVEIETILKDFVRPFDLKSAPLLRVRLIELPSDSLPQHIFVFDMHHIIADGVSLKILVDEIIALYQGKTLPALRIQYKDFAFWQNQLFLSEEIKKQEEYWQQLFSDQVPLLNLPTDYLRPRLKSYLGDKVELTLSREMTARLHKLARQSGTTLYMVLLAVYNLLLSRYSGQKDIVIGSPAAGRPHADLENIVGMFVNTLVMRTKLTNQQTFGDLLTTIKRQALQAYENQDYQFEKLVEKLELERDMSRHPLFDVMFAFQNYADEMKIVLDGLEFRTCPLPEQIAKFDLNLHAQELDEAIHLRLNYSTDLFKQATVASMLQHFANIIQEILENPALELRQIQMLSGPERQQVLYDFNATRHPYPCTKTIHQIFEEQAAKSPDHLALLYGDQQMTYAEVNRKANQIATELREKGVKAGTIVGLMVERSFEMMTGMLGIFKAGGAYLPIDPYYPEERIRYMLEDSQTGYLLTQSKFSVCADFSSEVLYLDHESCKPGSDDNGSARSGPHDLAYVIYTSGSTGRPKGVMVEHHAVVNTIDDLQRCHPLDPDDIILQSTVFTFDASGKEIFLWFFAGASLYLLEHDDHKSPQKIIEVIAKYKISKLRIVPVLLHEILNTIAEMGVDKVSSLKYIFCGGAAISKKIVERFFEIFPTGRNLYITYGPTEATLHCTKHVVTGLIQTPYVLLGKPVSNDQIYILDDSLQPVPTGVPGEIYIGGVGVARGYLNNPALTQQVFMENPFVPGERMYKSGDLGRWFPDGTIEFLGRIDNQIKIRGFRIEPGEIEKQLLAHEAIAEVVVIAKKDKNDNHYMVAYFVGKRKLNVTELREHLAARVPDYMVPAFFVQLDSLPLTHNGKVNYKALPEPDGRMETGAVYESPRNELEEILTNVWADVLGVANVGIHDSFYNLGGDSIKAIQIASRLLHHGLKLEVKHLFKYHTISELSGLIQQSTHTAEQGIVSGRVNLTSVQKAFFALNTGEKHHYNQAVMLYSPEPLDTSILQRVFAKIVEHHDALRMVYQTQGREVEQWNRGLEEPLYELKVWDVQGDGTELMEQEANLLQRSMDLAHGPLIKAGLFKTTEGDHLLIVAHHLVIDGVSWRILFEDIATAYQQILAGEEVKLPAKTTSFKTWADKLAEYANSKELLRQLDYWRSVMQTVRKSLPVEQEGVRRTMGEMVAQSVSLDPSYTKQLLKDVHTAFNTEINDLLLAALAQTIREWTGEQQVWISLEGHGREEILQDVDITRTVGWFTARYPVALRVDTDDMVYFLKSVKEELRRVPERGTGFGLLKFLASDAICQEFQAYPEPEISFNYFGQFAQDVNTALFGRSEVPVGMMVSPEIERPYALDITGMVDQGQLVFSFRYNPAELSDGQVQRLLERYMMHLRRLIDACTGQEVTELTPSDLGDETLSLEELDDILDVLGEE